MLVGSGADLVRLSVAESAALLVVDGEAGLGVERRGVARERERDDAGRDGARRPQEVAAAGFGKRGGGLVSVNPTGELSVSVGLCLPEAVTRGCFATAMWGRGCQPRRASACITPTKNPASTETATTPSPPDPQLDRNPADF